MPFRINYTEPDYNGGSFFYYAVIVNNEGLYYNPTTRVYEAFDLFDSYQIHLARTDLVVHTAELPEGFLTVKGVCRIYRLTDLSGSYADLANDLMVSDQPFFYREDYGDVITEKELLEFSERVIPLLNGTFNYVNQAQITQNNYLNELNAPPTGYGPGAVEVPGEPDS